MIRITKKFAIYVDRTADGRPFYVGKGKQKRINTPFRNKYHNNIACKHGVGREIVFETDDENAAFDVETKLIQEYKTFAFGGEGFWGANLTLGGEGRSGSEISQSTRLKMSSSQLRAWRETDRRLRTSETSKARWTDELRKEKSEHLTKVWASSDLRAEMSETIKKSWTPERRELHSKRMKAQHSRNRD